MWRLTFEDRFDGDRVDESKWCFQLGTGQSEGLEGWGNAEKQYYARENAQIIDGALVITARPEPMGGMPYTSARLCTRGLFSQAFGRFEARIRLPQGEGFWPAFWLMPEHSRYGAWAASGEIDIMESKGRVPRLTYHTLHFGGKAPSNTHVSKTFTLPEKTEADWHVYALEWEKEEMRWYVDDALAAKQRLWYTAGHDFPAPFDQPFYLLINLAVGGHFDGGHMPGSLGGPLEGRLMVDYVRVWQRADQE